ncbi:MAG: hypothetical protein ACR2HY_07640 [Acidimicrobiales bacterium]
MRRAALRGLLSAGMASTATKGVARLTASGHDHAQPHLCLASGHAAVAFPFAGGAGQEVPALALTNAGQRVRCGPMASRTVAKRVAASAAFAVVVAACGSGSSKSATNTTALPGGTVAGVTSTVAPPKAACDILSRDDVAAAVGNPVNDPQPSGTTDCAWGTAVDGGTSLALTIAKPGNPAAAAAECTAQRNGLPSELPKEPVAGVGTSAVWVLEPLTTIKQGHLVACWADSVVSVLLTGERDPGALRTTATGVVQKAHSRL